MELYLIYGLPGVGKLAVAKELSLLRPGYKLFHIHMLAAMLEPLFGFDGRGFIFQLKSLHHSVAYLVL